jgi:hypothetical protein
MIPIVFSGVMCNEFLCVFGIDSTSSAVHVLLLWVSQCTLLSLMALVQFSCLCIVVALFPSFGALRRICLQAGALAVLSLGVVNRVLYKMALVPMAGHVFFLAQAQNVCE